ncbi:MAG: arginyltransferase [Pseudomonadales bacterium]|nr:arginyltransferase [Pseudomonadales bacterium]
MNEKVSDKQFFLTPAHPCSYLEKRSANTLFLDPHDVHSPDTYENLTTLGFRRSGEHLYRPHCTGCSACIPARIPVAAFSANRRFRRVIKKNLDVHTRVENRRDDFEIYNLYEKYIALRHQDGDMYPTNIEQFRSFLFANWSETKLITSYLAGKLIAVAVTDFQSNALSAIYTFFDPELQTRSLGVHSILKQIDYCKSLKLQHLYLGYWIRDSAKMDYKIDYAPLELFQQSSWKLYQKAETNLLSAR